VTDSDVELCVIVLGVFYCQIDITTLWFFWRNCIGIRSDDVSFTLTPFGCHVDEMLGKYSDGYIFVNIIFATSNSVEKVQCIHVNVW